MRANGEAEIAEGFVFVPAAREKAAAAVSDPGEQPESVELNLFCGVRRYVALVIGRWQKRECGFAPNAT